MATVLGLYAVKINGVYRLDVVNATWDDTRSLSPIVTGGGVKMAIGAEIPTGTFGEVIPKTAIFNWRQLVDFSIQLYDFETRSILFMQAEGCNWGKIAGSADMQSANTRKNINWTGTLIPVV